MDPSKRPDRRYGRITSPRLRALVWACTGAGVLIFLAGVVMQWIAPSLRAWTTAMTIVGFAVGLYGFYLWVRLSE